MTEEMRGIHYKRKVNIHERFQNMNFWDVQIKLIGNMDYSGNKVLPVREKPGTTGYLGGSGLPY